MPWIGELTPVKQGMIRLGVLCAPSSETRMLSVKPLSGDHLRSEIQIVFLERGVRKVGTETGHSVHGLGSNKGVFYPFSICMCLLIPLPFSFSKVGRWQRPSCD